MNVNNMKNGMMVRISYNLDITHGRHTAISEMYDMCGKEYMVVKVQDSKTIIVRANNKCTYIFAPEDLCMAELPYQELKTIDLANIKSELFNPEQLIGD